MRGQTESLPGLIDITKGAAMLANEDQPEGGEMVGASTESTMPPSDPVQQLLLAALNSKPPGGDTPEWLRHPLVLLLVALLLGGGGVAGSASLSAIFSGENIAVLEAKVHDLEAEQKATTDVVSDMRDNQLLICNALDVDCVR